MSAAIARLPCLPPLAGRRKTSRLRATSQVTGIGWRIEAARHSFPRIAARMLVLAETVPPRDGLPKLASGAQVAWGWGRLARRSWRSRADRGARGPSVSAAFGDLRAGAGTG